MKLYEAILEALTPAIVEKFPPMKRPESSAHREDTVPCAVPRSANAPFGSCM